MRRMFSIIVLIVLAGCQKHAFQFDGQPRAIFAEAGIAHAERVALASTDNGNLLALGVDPAKKQLLMAVSHDGGDHFMAPVAVSQPGAEIQYRAENGPSLAARGMQVYALWQQARPQGGTDVVVATQRRMGEPFPEPVRVLDKPFTDTSFNGFSSMALGTKGEVYVVWLDGRDHAPPEGTFSLYLAKSTDQGRTFGKNIRIQSGVCPCCRPSVAVDDDGTVYVAWRKVFDRDVRDIVVASSRDGGETFAGPVKAADDRWVLHACPDSGPSLQARAGKVAVAWFSEGNKRSGIRYVVSSDHGKSFSSPGIASQGVEDANHPSIAMNGEGQAVLAFQGRDSHAKQGWGPFAVFVARADAAGNLSPPEPIPGGEGSSYPTAISPGLDRVAIAWTKGHDADANILLARTRMGGQ